LCCGSAGTCNILEPEIALRLRDRKIANIVQTSPDLVATGNIGCIAQIASGTAIDRASRLRPWRGLGLAG
jgi:glycolate oxidase iron-sulfur subunit